MARNRKAKPQPNTSAPTPPPPISTPLDKLDQLWLAFGLLLTGVVYGWTLWPSIAGGDNGELVGAACSLGIIHPPGYPLFTMLGHLFTYLPWGSPALRINLASVATQLVAWAIMYLACRRLTTHKWLAWSLPTLFAFSTLIWRYAVHAEVFALNNLFISLFVWQLIICVQEQRPKKAYLLAFLFGLALTNHHTFLFIGAPAGLFLLYYFRRSLLAPKPLLGLIGLIIIGMTPYYYIHWAAMQTPLLSWGDATTFKGFLVHLLRQEYGTFQLASSGAEQSQLLWGLFYYSESLLRHILFVLAVPLFSGVRALWLGKTQLPKSFGLLFLFIPVFYLIVFHILANLPYVEGAALYKDILSRFWVMPHWWSIILILLGVEDILSRPFPLTPVHIRGLFLALPFINLGVNFKAENHRDNLTFENFGRHIIEPLPQGALFFSLGDINTNTVRYLQNCEGFRTDVKVIDRSLMSYTWMKRIAQKHYPTVTLPGAAYHPSQKGFFDLKRLFDANMERHQVFITTIKTKDSLEASDKIWENTYSLMPYGLTMRVFYKNQIPPIDQYIEDSKKYLLDPLAEFKVQPVPGSWESVVQSNYWLAHHMRAAEILKYALRTQEKKYFQIAEQLLEELVARNPTPPADYFKNLGIAHQHLSKLSVGPEQKKHETRMLEVWSVYVQKTDRRDKTYQDIVSVLRAFGRG